MDNSGREDNTDMQRYSAIFRKAFSCVERWRRSRYRAFFMLLSVTAGLLVLVMSAGFFTGSDSSTVYAVRSSTGSGKGLDGLGGRQQASGRSDGDCQQRQFHGRVFQCGGYREFGKQL